MRGVRRRTLIAAALAVPALVGAGAVVARTGPDPGAAPSSAHQEASTPPSSVPPSVPSGTVPPSAGSSSDGWTVTVYYTAVEEFHTGPETRVTGCLILDCAYGRDDLGRYRADFVAAVRTEGAGRARSGRYLNWSYDVGFWLDDAPRDTVGRPLRPFVSAAADADVLRAGTRFRIAACGTDEEGGEIPAAVCTRLRASRWTVVDEFTPGFGGPRHVDAYIGEETGPDFTTSDLYTTLVGARLTLDRPSTAGG
jgi:hypothetical protein